MTTIYVQKAEDLAFATLVASEIAKSMTIECRAALLEGPLESGALCLVRRKTSVRKKKRGGDVRAEFEILGTKVPAVLKWVIATSGSVDDPSRFDPDIAGMVAREMQAILVERARTTPRTAALYAIWCGIGFAETAAEAFGNAGLPCEIRREHPSSYPEAERPWGRIAPGPIARIETGAELALTDVVFGELANGEHFASIKVKTPPNADENAVHRALAAKLVARVEKVIGQLM